MELVEQLLTFENVIDGSTAVFGAEAIYQAAVRSTFDYRDDARDLETGELREEIHSMHAGHMIGERGLHDEDAVVIDLYRPRRHQKKKHFAEVYNERMENSRETPLDVEMYDDLLMEEILMDM